MIKVIVNLPGQTLVCYISAEMFDVFFKEWISNFVFGPRVITDCIRCRCARTAFSFAEVVIDTSTNEMLKCRLPVETVVDLGVKTFMTLTFDLGE